MNRSFAHIAADKLISCAEHYTQRSKERFGRFECRDCGEQTEMSKLHS